MLGTEFQTFGARDEKRQALIIINLTIKPTDATIQINSTRPLLKIAAQIF